MKYFVMFKHRTSDGNAFFTRAMDARHGDYAAVFNREEDAHEDALTEARNNTAIVGYKVHTL